MAQAGARLGLGQVNWGWAMNLVGQQQRCGLGQAGLVAKWRPGSLGYGPPGAAGLVGRAMSMTGGLEAGFG